jgi:hypothetical protein
MDMKNQALSCQGDSVSSANPFISKYVTFSRWLLDIKAFRKFPQLVPHRSSKDHRNPPVPNANPCISKDGAFLTGFPTSKHLASSHLWCLHSSSKSHRTPPRTLSCAYMQTLATYLRTSTAAVDIFSRSSINLRTVEICVRMK